MLNQSIFFMRISKSSRFERFLRQMLDIPNMFYVKIVSYIRVSRRSDP